MKERLRRVEPAWRYTETIFILRPADRRRDFFLRRIWGADGRRFRCRLRAAILRPVLFRWLATARIWWWSAATIKILAGASVSRPTRMMPGGPGNWRRSLPPDIARPLHGWTIAQLLPLDQAAKKSAPMAACIGNRIVRSI